MFDTKHGTNTHKLKLGCFCTVGPSGNTVVLAASLVASESEASFIWVFSCFLLAFRIAPAVIFTDSDPGMAAAILAVFCLLGTLHFLCTWHLSKNLLTHVKPSLFSAPAGLESFTAAWWTLCLRSDASSVAAFASEWDALLAPIRAGPFSEARTSALEWLNSLYQRREKWAARFTWQTLTLTIHSTQRGEAVHSAVERFCSASMLLTVLLQRLDEYGVSVDVRAETRDVLRCLRLLQREQNQAVAPIISSASRFLTPYAVLLLTAQWQQSLQYKVTTLEDGLHRVERLSPAAATHMLTIAEQAADAADGVGGTPTFSTARTTSLVECSCQFPCSVGLPCRHQLAVAAQLQMHDAGRLVSVAHWRLLAEEERAALVRGLLSAPLPAPATQPTAREIMSKTDRFALLMSEWRGVAGAACESPAATEWALTEVARVGGALRSVAAPAAGAAPAAAPRRRGVGTADGVTRVGRGPAVPAAALALRATHEAAQEAPACAAGAPHAGAVVTAPRKETCGACGVLGHRSRNTHKCTKHPLYKGPLLPLPPPPPPPPPLLPPAPQAVGLRAPPPLPPPPQQPAAAQHATAAVEPVPPSVAPAAAASDSDDVPLAGRQDWHALHALPPGPPPPAPPPAAGGKRKRDAVSRAARPGGQAAPPVAAPAGVPSRGRPQERRIRSHWERRKSG